MDCAADVGPLNLAWLCIGLLWFSEAELRLVDVMEKWRFMLISIFLSFVRCNLHSGKQQVARSEWHWPLRWRRRRWRRLALVRLFAERWPSKKLGFVPHNSAQKWHQMMVIKNVVFTSDGTLLPTSHCLLLVVHLNKLSQQITIVSTLEFPCLDDSCHLAHDKSKGLYPS